MTKSIDIAGVPFVRAHIRLSILLLTVAVTGCHMRAGAPLLPATSITADALPAASQDLTATPLISNSLDSTTSGTVGLVQIFDAFANRSISPTQAEADGPRYGVVWGSQYNMPPYWRMNNVGITSTYYMIQSTDISQKAWGAIGHPLSWWQTYHPDWVLYACTPSGTPTKTPAYISQLPYNMPLDMHNPAVISYQVKAAATYAIAHGYTGLAVDEVLFVNVTGTGVGSGYYGCGIYQKGTNTFVRRYSGFRDPVWATDTVAWVKTARSILRTDPVIGPKLLKLVVNHPAGSVTSTSASAANERAILENVDADLDETGFSDYGNYQQSIHAGLFKATLDWMNYAQSHSSIPMIVDKFYQQTAITPLQLEFSIATYMMGNNTSARLFVGNANSYGTEQYHAEYATKFGAPCGAYYGGAVYDATNPHIYYRRFANAVVVVNSGSLPKTSEVAHLPAGHVYTDLEHRSVTNPLKVASSDAFVLLTTNGCH